MAVRATSSPRRDIELQGMGPQLDLPKIDSEEEKSEEPQSLSLLLEKQVEEANLHALLQKAFDSPNRVFLEETLHSPESASWEKAVAAKYLACLFWEQGDSEKERAEEHYAEARKYFEAGFKECKTSEKLIFDYLEFLQERSEFPRALEVCNEAIEQNPQLVHLLRLQAKILDSLSLEKQVELFNEGRLEEASFRIFLEKTFHSPESTPSEKAEAAKYLARLYLRKGDSEKKQMRSEEIKGIDEEDHRYSEEAQRYFEKANRHFERAEKHYAEARKCFEAGFKECKTSEKLTFDYLEFLQERREFSRALEVCNEAIEQNPQLANFLRLRAKIHASLLDWPKALEDSLAFLGFKDPKNIYEKKRAHQIEMFNLAGDCCMELKRYKDACGHYRNAYKLERGMKNRAEQTTKLLKARLLEELPKDLPEEFQRMRLEGAIALAKEKKREALKAFEDILKSEELDPASLFRLFLARAKLHLALDDPASARADLEHLEKIVLPAVSDADRPVRKMELYRCFAELCENREEERNYFLAVWEEGKSDKEFISDYINFLKREKNYEEAERICIESREVLGTQFKFLQAQIYFDNRKGALAKQLCDELLQEEDLSTKSQLLILDAAIKGCRNMIPPPLEDIYYYLREAFLLDKTPKCLERHRNLLQAHEKLVKVQASSLLDPPRKSNKELLEIAEESLKEDPQGALEVLGAIGIEALDPPFRWIPLLVRAVVHMKLNDLASARIDVDSAWRIVHPPKFFQFSKELNSNEMQVLYVRAGLYVLEEKINEALKDIENGWKNGEPTPDFIWRYLNILHKENLPKAFEICMEAYYRDFGEFNYWNWQVVLRFEAEEWSKVVSACRQFLPLTEKKPEFQFAALDKLVTAQIKMHRYSEAKQKVLEISQKETDASRSLHWAKRLQEISRASIVYNHLEELVKDAILNKELSLPQKISYLQELREAYQEEPYGLREVGLPWWLGQLLVEADRSEEALEEYQIALKTAKNDPQYSAGTIEDAIKKLKKK